MRRPTLFVPVENQVRELDAKLLFGCIAAARGFNVVLGYKQLLHIAMPDFPPGIFIAKSMRAGSKLMFDIITGLGHELVAWDEESLVRYDSPEYYAWRFTPDTFNRVRHLFAWGVDDAEMFAAYPGNHGVRVHTTGNPRADLLRPELRSYFDAECAQIRQRHGEFVLVNTNFSFVNPFLKDIALVRPAGLFGRPESRTAAGMSSEFAQSMAAHQAQIFEHFRRLLPALARRFPERKIILRPHPSEDHELWRVLLGEHANVEVLHEGNVVPWLMSAAVLVHNGCTTAVEAALVERPVVAFRPVRSASLDYALPNALSHDASSIDEVLETVAAVLRHELGQIDAAERQRLFDRHLSASGGALASERIVTALESLGYAETALDRPRAMPATLARAKAALRTAIKRFNMKRSDHWAGKRYNAHRFPGVTLDEINARIARFHDVLGRFEPVRARACGAALFSIERVNGASSA